MHSLTAQPNAPKRFCSISYNLQHNRVGTAALSTLTVQRKKYMNSVAQALQASASGPIKDNVSLMATARTADKRNLSQ